MTHLFLFEPKNLMVGKPWTLYLPQVASLAVLHRTGKCIISTCHSFSAASRPLTPLTHQSTAATLTLPFSWVAESIQAGFRFLHCAQGPGSANSEQRRS